MSPLILRVLFVWSLPDDPIAEEFTCPATLSCPDHGPCMVELKPGCAAPPEACPDASVRLPTRRELTELDCTPDGQRATVRRP